MNTIFEKTIDDNHNNTKMVVPLTKQLKSESDYNEKELNLSIEHTKNNDLIKFKKIKYEAYKEWGFPIWKRAKLKGYSPKKYYPNLKTVTGNFQKINDIDSEGIEILAKYDFEGADRKFLLMAEVFSNTGFYLKTEENENKTISVKYLLEESIYENSIIQLKPNSKATLIRFIEGKNDEGFKTSSIRGILEKNSVLNIINVNLLTDEDINIDNLFFDIKDNADLNIYDLNIGGKVSSPYIFNRLSGKGAQSKIKPYFIGVNNNIIDMLYLLRFIGEETTGNINGKGILKDYSKAVFRGFLDIKKGAKEANASEEEFTLVLSENAKAQAIPSLLVDENEVNAAHAASVGTLDENKMYYLMSRGFSKIEAKRLISYAIFEPVLEEIEKIDKNTYEVIKNAIECRI